METVLKWHGGKAYLAKSIVGLMPARCRNPNKPDPADPGWLHYVEPFAGGLSVLLANDPEGISEVVSDLNGPLTDFWRVIGDAEWFPRFERHMQTVMFNEREWQEAEANVTGGLGVIDRAAAFFIRCRQSLAGRMDAFTGVTRTRTRRGMNAEASAWLSAVEGLHEFHARMKRVLVLNRDALAVIRKEDGPRTLFYLDPPYLHETRATTGEYSHEMTAEQHAELLTALADVEGRFLLSGYRSQLYDGFALGCGWSRHDFEIANHAAGGDSKRRMTECVWCNF